MLYDYIQRLTSEATWQPPLPVWLTPPPPLSPLSEAGVGVGAGAGAGAAAAGVGSTAAAAGVGSTAALETALFWTDQINQIMSNSSRQVK